MTRQMGSDPGYFYAMQMFPDTTPNRIKLGWSADVARRLRDYKTGAPTVRVFKAWACRRMDEPRIIERVAELATQRLSPESFDFPDLDELVATVEDCLFVIEQFRTGVIKPTIRDLAIKDMAQSHAATGAPAWSKGPYVGRSVRLALLIPFRIDKAQARGWLQERLWNSLTDYFVEIAADDYAEDGRIVRIQIEIEK